MDKQKTGNGTEPSEPPAEQPNIFEFLGGGKLVVATTTDGETHIGKLLLVQGPWMLFENGGVQEIVSAPNLCSIKLSGLVGNRC